LGIHKERAPTDEGKSEGRAAKKKKRNKAKLEKGESP
jgi:hypothetical protein